MKGRKQGFLLQQNRRGDNSTLQLRTIEQQQKDLKTSLQGMRQNYFCREHRNHANKRLGLPLPISLVLLLKRIRQYKF